MILKKHKSKSTKNQEYKIKDMYLGDCDCKNIYTYINLRRSIIKAMEKKWYVLLQESIIKDEVILHIIEWQDYELSMLFIDQYNYNHYIIANQNIARKN